MKKDKAEKSFFSDDRRFADVFNGLVFGGRQIVHPQDLKDVDSEIGNVRQSLLCGRIIQGALKEEIW